MSEPSIQSTKDDFHFHVMPAEAYLGAGSAMINIRQEWTSAEGGETFVRVMIHERDAERLCTEIMAAAAEARK